MHCKNFNFQGHLGRRRQRSYVPVRVRLRGLREYLNGAGNVVHIVYSGKVLLDAREDLGTQTFLLGFLL